MEKIMKLFPKEHLDSEFVTQEKFNKRMIDSEKNFVDQMLKLSNKR